tara:strand:+ start:260 stop:361 length:102 start_codon:yes stop_codon:yes gene_type:complete
MLNALYLATGFIDGSGGYSKLMLMLSGSTNPFI